MSYLTQHITLYNVNRDTHLLYLPLRNLATFCRPIQKGLKPIHAKKRKFCSQQNTRAAPKERPPIYFHGNNSR